MTKKVFFYDTIIGRIGITEEAGAISRVFYGADTTPDPHIIGTPLIQKTYKQISEYLSGKRASFDLPLAIHGTEFQKKVWDQLTKIPFGKTCNYKDIATNMEKPGASRAIGMANNKNPLMIIIPCHRVVGTNGDLVGYAGGIAAKQYLLDIEKRYEKPTL